MNDAVISGKGYGHEEISILLSEIAAVSWGQEAPMPVSCTIWLKGHDTRFSMYPRRDDKLPYGVQTPGAGPGIWHVGEISSFDLLKKRFP